MANTVRGVRLCEVCAGDYRPTYHQQRACGRACGTYLRIGRWPSQPVSWSDCPAFGLCFAWPNRKLGACSTTCYAALTVWTPDTPEPPVECDSCGGVFVPPNRRGWVYCSHRCSRRAVAQRRKVREAGTYGQWRWSDFMRVARKFGYCCAYCGDKPTRLDPDHVVPLSKGGPNVLANLLPACQRCNGQKTDMLLADWAEFRRRKGLPPLHTDWDASDQRYWHLTAMTVAA
jgi:5-methylcytosine-specific restriction endonuclease McrA